MRTVDPLRACAGSARWRSLRGRPATTTPWSSLSRDRRHGGGLLAGALAFRLFGALLPLALLLAVVLGYAATVDSSAPQRGGRGTGISEALLTSVAESSKLAAGTRWIVLVDARRRAAVGGDLGGAGDPRGAQHRVAGQSRALPPAGAARRCC